MDAGAIPASSTSSLPCGSFEVLRKIDNTTAMWYFSLIKKGGLTAMVNCEKLSPAAAKIFKKLKGFFPPDPWKKPRWKKEGIVIDNGEHDLRKSTDRIMLMSDLTSTLGSLVRNSASVFQKKNGTLDGFEIEHFGLMIRNKVEVLLILNELDFQIETLDLVES